jgi:hypothetical protein
MGYRTLRASRGIYVLILVPQAPNKRGATSGATARARELMDVTNDTCYFLAVYMHNVSKLMEGREPQSKETAQAFLDNVTQWCRR